MSARSRKEVLEQGQGLLRRRMALSRMCGAVCLTILGLRASDPPGWKPRWVSTSADAMIRPVDGGSFSACWSGGWTGAIPVGLGQPFPRAMASRSWRCIQVCGGAGCSVRSTSARSCSGGSPSGRLEWRRPTATTARSSTTMPRSARGRSFEPPWNTLDRSGNLAKGSQGRLAQRADCGDDSERNYHETGLDYGRAEDGNSCGRLPPGGRSSKTPRHRWRLAEKSRSNIQQRNIKWLTPFPGTLFPASIFKSADLHDFHAAARICRASLSESTTVCPSIERWASGRPRPRTSNGGSIGAARALFPPLSARAVTVRRIGVYARGGILRCAQQRPRLHLRIWNRFCRIELQIATAGRGIKEDFSYAPSFISGDVQPNTPIIP